MKVFKYSSKGDIFFRWYFPQKPKILAYFILKKEQMN